MEENTKINIRHVGDVVVFDLSGELTSYSEKILEQSYEEASKQGAKKLCFNFREVSYINSAGMAIVISILTQSRKSGQALTAFGLTEHFKKIFDMVGITKYMQHYDTEEDAVKAL